MQAFWYYEVDWDFRGCESARFCQRHSWRSFTHHPDSELEEQARESLLRYRHINECTGIVVYRVRVYETLPRATVEISPQPHNLEYVI